MMNFTDCELCFYLTAAMATGVLLPKPASVYDVFAWASGGRLNKKDGLTRYGDSHAKDKTS